MDDSAEQVLLDILAIGLRRVRRFAHERRPELCHMEADHLHNLPALISSFRWDLLVYYFDTERPSYMERNPVDLEEFGRAWEQLGRLMRQHSQL